MKREQPGFKRDNAPNPVGINDAAAGEDGMALVIVLASIVFLVALAIAFLSTSRMELKTSATYAEGGRAQLLGQTAVNLATSQITEGTRGLSANGKLVAWASQPGMIRTYDEAGDAVNYYKLYSWSDMTGTGAFSPSQEVLRLASWSADKAIFTDLNQPMISGTSQAYPILDGNGLTLATTASGSPGKTYEDQHGGPSIEGFSIANSAPVDGSAGSNPVPMPVMWLYVLKGGQIIAPSGGSGETATFSGADQPTADNPIIGRIAFWVDDETCKVNINTASEGVYWDSPRLTSLSKDDWMLQSCQPVNGEYQRYPGHPGMTSLSAVFPDLTPAEIHVLAPRFRSGGSDGGLKRTTWTTDGPPSFSPLSGDPERLYASVDELFFKPNRTASHPSIDQTKLERSRFFLTASGRAPELNLFGKPRVSIWPVHVTDSSARRSAYDAALAFCASMRNDLGKARYRYYFQREDSDDPTHDLPGTGSVTGLGRNRMLLEYLRDLSSRDIPGFGGNFAEKYGAADSAGIVQGTERDQILTQIFDYIRSTNLADTTLPTSGWFAPGGQVVPIEDTVNGTRGFGRYRTVQGANLLFIGVADSTVADALPPVPPQTIRIQAMFLPQLFSVAVGSVFLKDTFQVRIEGLHRFEWAASGTQKSMGFPEVVTTTFPDNDEGNPKAWRGGGNWGDQFGVVPFAYQLNYEELLSETLDVPANPVPGSFQFFGGDVKFSFYNKSGKFVQSVTLNFPDGIFPAPLLANGSYKIGSYGPFNMRSIAGRKAANSTSFSPDWWLTTQDVIRSVSATDGDIRLVAARKVPPEPDNPKYQFSKNALYDNLSYPLKWAHNLWIGTGFPFQFTRGIAGGPPGVPGGKLVASAHYDTTTARVFPDVPLNGVAVGKKTSFVAGDIPGDWDTGVAEMKDGPFINKPDEGDIGNGTGTTTTANPYKWKSLAGVHIPSQTLFTPNRLVASAGAFGSLPSGVLADKPWQTLLFRPGPIGHPGLGTEKQSGGAGSALAGRPPYVTPPDHLLLDLFWMPVVEPYPISEPFSTAGKINMNFQIVPFTYINRDTGVRAVLKSEKVISMETSGTNCNALNYKVGYGDLSNRKPGMSRQAVDIDETLVAFRERFASGDIFRSATEICDLDIVPADYSGVKPHTRASMDQYWSSRLLTGDNCRERPYSTIYPRLTTQSNTYTIHFRAQALQKVPGTDPSSWTEGRDRITGESRGSQTVERYIDPNNTDLPDFASASTDVPAAKFYKFRTVNSKQFNP